jgi:hypothetical protein
VLPIQQVLDALQAIIEGMDPVIPTLNTEVFYQIWKTIKIGGVKPEVLRSRIEKNKQLAGMADRPIMQQSSFTTLDAEESIDLIILSPEDFGFTESPLTDEFLDSKRLADWSAYNLEGRVVEICPAEVGPHLREQYGYQPEHETLWIAIERIVDSKYGFSRVFTVERSTLTCRFLNSEEANPGSRWDLDRRTVFRLRKTILS